MNSRLIDSLSLANACRRTVVYVGCPDNSRNREAALSLVHCRQDFVGRDIADQLQVRIYQLPPALEHRG